MQTSRVTDHAIPQTKLDKAVVRLVYRSRRSDPIGKLARRLCQLVGVEVPHPVRIGPGLTLPHSTVGLVLHTNTRVGAGVTIFQNVTVGQADVINPSAEAAFDIGDDAVIGAGAALLARSGQTLRIGAGAMIGANAVVTKDVGPGETWAGNPARLVSSRAPAAPSR